MFHTFDLCLSVKLVRQPADMWTVSAVEDEYRLASRSHFPIARTINPISLIFFLSRMFLPSKTKAGFSIPS